MSAVRRVLIKCVYCERCLIGDPDKFTADDLRSWKVHHEVNECV